jgi:uroporphyrinogen decarboxylase
MSRSNRFLAACRAQPVDAAPIWLMRQAGRYMPEYRALRANHRLLDMIKTPELAAEVTLQPVRAFDVDAAIIFADILQILDEVGLSLEFVEGHGPVLHHPVHGPDDVEGLDRRTGSGGLEQTLAAIRRVKRQLEGTLPLIGFAGAPFTLACYAVEGGSSKEFLRAKQFMYNQEPAWRRLLEMLTSLVADYLVDQVHAGADAIQLFDSWAGILSPADFADSALPYAREIVRRVQACGVPVIYFGTGLSGCLEEVRRIGADVIGLDWRIGLAQARTRLGEAQAIQGNLDPAVLLASAERIRRAAGDLIETNGGRPGFIFNLGHGVHKETPPDHVQALVDAVHQYRYSASRP